jgi:hypothetical protein
MLSVIMLSVIMLIVFYAKRHKKFYYAVCRYAKCRGALLLC